MSSQDDGDDVANKTTVQMHAREVHFHVLDMALPAEWKRVTPQVWTKERDALETYEATVGGYALRVDLRQGDAWKGRLEAPDGSVSETEQFERQVDAVRALANLLDAKK
jgi:hypothetical protein